ncbi:phosphoglycerate transport regulatory protein PgtC [Klebsiella pneumoniae]|nr:phosphoglycerate transport regulatory protein PgtC [Klebsiella pneumoniae]SLX38220.1 phosphoglycerate transport regulatory protein PgtC [Klebsiella pneumoniae]SLZ38811.1 phosphoglycerate transport regulatory protein PgtC [Klebsiella pneumoniae]SLZ90800.1 phosphoglycerate transport regulatory protein PgtC [Klebsiella pneumoniae]VAM41935.1 phosphoglycerate transport system regulatory protein [Klebsiella pneumoniae]
MLALLLLTAWLRPCAAQSNELVMATTFSPSATVWIIDRWQKEMIRTLNRISASLIQLLDLLLLHMEALLNKSELARA